METLDLQQGTIAWHEHRAKHFNASDAPTMMGESKYKSRSELIRERQTGITQDVDAATQRRFDDGHRFEALARNLAEDIVDDELYPVTGVNGKLSASFDGISLLEDVIFEHKSLNDSLRAVQSVGGLPLMYRIQMEQQLYVSGAEKCLFMASKWDDDNQLIDEIHFWYEPDLALREKIIAGWEQFEADLEIWEPVAHQEKPVAEATESLPILSIRVNGELAIVSNLGMFGEQLRHFVSHITKDPQDDQDFANLESAVKKLKEAEDALEKAETYALAQIEDVNSMRQAVSELKELARSSRLTSEKLVKSQKEVIKLNILNGVRDKFRLHINGLQKDIPVRIEFAEPDFGGAMKNKRTIASLHDAVDVVLANAKADANSLADELRQKHTWYFEHASDYRFLFNDLQTLISKPREDFELVITSRIAAHEKAEADKREAQRLQIQAEEEAKAKRKAEAEQTQKLEAERAVIREEERVKAEAQDRADRAEKAELDRLDAVQKMNERQAAITEAVIVKNSDDGIIVTSTPTRQQLIDAIANTFGVIRSTAENWLVNEFKPRPPHYDSYFLEIKNCKTLSELSALLKEMPKEIKADAEILSAISKRQDAIKSLTA